MDNDPNVERERAKHPKRIVAVVFLYDRNGRVLLVRTKRLPNQWQPIGGGMKPHDASVEATAIREVQEETRLSLAEGTIEKVLETPYDFGDGSVHFFRVRVPDGTTLTMDDVELAEWRWVALADVASLPTFPATATCVAYLLSRPWP